MGRSKESKQVSNRINTEYQRIGPTYDDYQTRTQQSLLDAQKRAGEVYGQSMSNWQRFLQPGFGINPQARGVYSEFARTGGMSPENINRMRGLGVYDEFARTGGLSEGDISNLRSRGTATVPRFFEGIRDELTRQKALQGGYAPGYDAQMAATVRDSAQAGQRAALDTETGIIDTRNRGRMWGTEGLSGAEAAIVAALQRGRLGGAAGLQGQDEASAGFNIAGAQGMNQLYGMTPGEVGMYEQLLLRALGQRDAATGNIIGQDAAYHPNQTWWQKYGMPIVGAGAGAAGAYLSGQPGSATSRQTGFGPYRSDYGDF